MEPQLNPSGRPDASPSFSSSVVATPLLPAETALDPIIGLPDPRTHRDDPERAVEPSATNFYQAPFSRVGIGADVSPLGIGIKSAVVLNTDFDARLMGNFFGYDTGRFEIDGANVDVNLHLASLAAALDYYPWRSVWRFSAGGLLYNGNRISATGRVAAGSSVDLNGTTFYSANPNPATGATPLTGSGSLALHTWQPALTLSGGFGRFIPRSERHWSFPSEFGVVLMGPPAFNVNVAGWACLDKAQTQCSDVGNSTNPIAIQFNNALQSRLAKFRSTLNGVKIYPVFSYSVVYSFDVR